MPVKKRPHNPLPPHYVPAGGTPYRVKTNDDLISVARAHRVSPEDFVIYNFNTVNTTDINWYLRHNVE